MRILLLLCLVTVNYLSGADWSKAKIKRSNVESSRISKAVVTCIESKYQMECVGTGFAMFGGPIRKLNFSFSTQAVLSQADARRLIIACINDIVEMINHDKAVQPYLEKRPFTIKNLGAVIFFRDSVNKEVAEPYVSFVGNIGNDICYYFYSADGEPTREIEEPFEDAVEMVRGESI